LERIGERVQRVEQVALDDSKRVSDSFKPVQSNEQIVPIIDSLVHDIERVFQVNIPNAGQIVKGFPENLVVECQGVVSGAGIRGVSVPPFPAKLMAGAMIPRWHQAELMVQALRTGDPDLVLLYLLNDHRTQTLAQAEGLLREWFADPRNERLARHFGRTSL
jgi:alpha-galactosidase